MNNEEIEKLSTSIFEFSDNSEELLAAGIDWSNPAFPGLYKISLKLCQSHGLPLKDKHPRPPMEDDEYSIKCG